MKRKLFLGAALVGLLALGFVGTGVATAQAGATRDHGPDHAVTRDHGAGHTATGDHGPDHAAP